MHQILLLTIFKSVTLVTISAVIKKPSRVENAISDHLDSIFSKFSLKKKSALQNLSTNIFSMKIAWVSTCNFHLIQSPSIFPKFYKNDNTQKLRIMFFKTVKEGLDVE